MDLLYLPRRWDDIKVHFNESLPQVRPLHYKPDDATLFLRLYHSLFLSNTQLHIEICFVIIFLLITK